DRPVGAGFVVDVPGLAVDLPEAVHAAGEVRADRPRPLEVEAQGFGTGQIRLGDRIGRQRRWPVTGRLAARHAAQGGEAQRAVAQLHFLASGRHLQGQIDAHARAEQVFPFEVPGANRVAVEGVGPYLAAGQI